MKGRCRWSMLAALAVSFACGGSHVTSRWITGAVRVDGNGEEWSGPELAYVEELGGVVGAANSDSVLCLMMRFGDAALGRKITFGGATVWWNRDGKKKKDVGIRFAPLVDIRHPHEQGGNPRMAPSGIGWAEGGAGPWEGPPEGPLHNLVTLLRDGGEMLLLEGEAGPVAAASTFHAGLYCYEVRIPLQRGAGAWGMDVKPGEDVRLCLALGGVSSEAEERMEDTGGEREGRRGGGPGGWSPGGGGMGPGGVPAGGMGRGRGGPRGMGAPGGMGRGRGPVEMLQKTELWCTIRLAEEPEDTAGVG